MLSWTWKDRLTFTNESLSFEIGFTSNGQHFDKLLVQKEDAARYLGYCNGSTCTLAYDSGTWNNTAFKKLTFDTLPTKELWALMVFQATADAAVSKVEVNGVTLIDISYDTVTPATLAKGYYAHNATGERIVGTLDASSSGADYNALRDFGDATGNGVVIATPDRLECRIYSPAAAFSWADDGFEHMIIYINFISTDVATQVDSYASDLMTNYVTQFNNVFSGASKAYFVDSDHVCDIPAFQTSDAKTFAGLKSAILRSVNSAEWSNNFRSPLFMEPQDYIKWYTEKQSSNNVVIGDKIRMPYVFGPAVTDGDPVTTAYNLQDPTGSMPTWDNGYVMYQGDSGDACGCFNVIPAYGVTSQFFLGQFNSLGGMIAKSDSAQTLPSAFLQQLNPAWKYGNLSLPAGWSVIQIVEDTAEVTALPIAQIQAMLSQIGGIDISRLPFDTMDSYTKSYFSDIKIQKYKKLNDKTFTLEFNLYAKE